MLRRGVDHAVGPRADDDHDKRKHRKRRKQRKDEYPAHFAAPAGGGVRAHEPPPIRITCTLGITFAAITS